MRARTCLDWSEELAYAVGLLATDGCLSSSGRHIYFDSNDEELVETFLRCVGRQPRALRTRTRIGHMRYRAALGDVGFYRWLQTIGLTPRKSLTLGSLDVPDAFFLASVRGLLDGDGSIYVKMQRPTRATYPEYEYERLWVYFTSASERHLAWLRDRLHSLLEIEGWIERRFRSRRNPFFRLRYGKRDAIILLTRLYERPEAPRLDRKWRKWEDYRLRRLSAEGGT